MAFARRNFGGVPLSQFRLIVVDFDFDGVSPRQLESIAMLVVDFEIDVGKAVVADETLFARNNVGVSGVPLDSLA
jgi:hypothetical protein